MARKNAKAQNEMQAQVEAQVEAQAPVVIEDAAEDTVEAGFIEQVDLLLNDNDQIDMARTTIADAFDSRVAFERTKNANNDGIVKSLDKSRAKLTQARSVATLLIADVTPDFITRSTHEGSAYNVYAADKLADLVQALNSGTIGNAINRAVMKSLFAFRAAGETFTGDMARASASDKLRVQGAIAKLLTRHSVSASTAPTQASSTMQALQTLGVVENKGTARAPVYELTDTAMTRREQFEY